MVNEAIVKTPVALFLGAGASQSLGMPLMAPFVQMLKERHPFAGDPLFQAIVKKEADLEFLFEELDDWTTKEYYGDPGSPGTGLYGAVRTPDAVGPLPGSPCRQWFGQVVRSATELLAGLKKEVFNQYSWIGNRGMSVQVLNPLLGAVADRLRSPQDPLVVFSTNYDRAVEVFCEENADDLSLHDGFVPQHNSARAVWHRGSIDQLQAGAESRRPLVLFKLHGSTTWFRERPPTGYDISDAAARLKAAVGGTFIKSDVAVHAGDDAMYENLLVYPAQRKVASAEPYFTAYDYFQRTLECKTALGPKLCIFVGYSFRDLDCLSRLRSAARHNPGLRLLVIDPNAKKLCETLAGVGVPALPVAAVFGYADPDTWLGPLGAALDDTLPGGSSR